MNDHNESVRATSTRQLVCAVEPLEHLVVAPLGLFELPGELLVVDVADLEAMLEVPPLIFQPEVRIEVVGHDAINPYRAISKP